MKELDILHPIKAELLNCQYYFQSLIEQAKFCGLLSGTDISRIQSDLIIILAEQTDKWNKGESSSIPIEKAQDIMTSIMFVIGIQLKSYKVPEKAIDMLKTEPMKTLFEKGLKLVRRKIVVSRHLQKHIADNLLDSPNVYYRSTVIDGINGFFKMYRPQFSAHEIHITADYPVYIGRPKLDGIEFIEQYLRCIEVENAFCMCFAPQNIHHLLCGITQDYRSVPMNLFEPVLLSALGLTILNRNPQQLNLTKKDINCLYKEFFNKSENEIESCLQKAVYMLDKEIELPKSSKLYITLCIPNLINTIHSSVMIKTLDKVFIVPNYPEHEPKIILSYGEKMDDRKYQQLVEKILYTDNAEEKISLILQEVHSLADLLDILSDTELCEGDFELLINMLPPSVFVALLSQYPNDDFLDKESEQLLFKALQKRKQRLSFEEKQQVEQALEAIQKEDF